MEVSVDTEVPAGQMVAAVKIIKRVMVALMAAAAVIMDPVPEMVRQVQSE
jgi:hypothetical protein